MHFCINWWKQRNQPKKRIVSEIASSRSFLCLCFSCSRSQSVRLVAVGFIHSTQFNNFPMLAIAECIRVAVSIWPTFIPFRFSVLNCTQWIASRFDFIERLSSILRLRNSTVLRSTHQPGKYREIFEFASMINAHLKMFGMNRKKSNNHQSYNLRAVVGQSSMLVRLQRAHGE